ncbi:MAG TPA: DUF3147 family protein [Candidatus Dormibacteraeota bacterium]
MNIALTVVLKPLVAGCLVAVMSQLSTALRPKMFAGLFAAAPSVATASLLVTALSKPSSVQPSAAGMIAGAVGMIACCLVAMLLVPRVRSLLASGAGWVAWTLVAAGAYWSLYR